MTQKEFAEKYSQAQLKEIARDIAGSIVIRDYVNGNSRDTRRETTATEKEIISKIAYGAMIAYSFRSNGGSIDSILDVAEFTLLQFIPEANVYDTIYLPLRKVTETSNWKGW